MSPNAQAAFKAQEAPCLSFEEQVKKLRELPWPLQDAKPVPKIVLVGKRQWTPEPEPADEASSVSTSASPPPAKRQHKKKAAVPKASTASTPSAEAPSKEPSRKKKKASPRKPPAKKAAPPPPPRRRWGPDAIAREPPSIAYDGIFAPSGLYAESYETSSFANVDPEVFRNPAFGSFTGAFRPFDRA